MDSAYKEFTVPYKELRDLVVAGEVIEQVSSVKCLGVVLLEDQRWTRHVDYITFKKASRNYFLRLLKRAGVPPKGDGTVVVRMHSISPRIRMPPVAFQSNS